MKEGKRKGRKHYFGQNDKFLILLFNFYQKKCQSAKECYFLPKLKVTKSQEQFFLELHCPKTNKMLIFSSLFWAIELQEKCFWDLLTFIKYFCCLGKKCTKNKGIVKCKKYSAGNCHIYIFWNNFQRYLW